MFQITEVTFSEHPRLQARVCEWPFPLHNEHQTNSDFLPGASWVCHNVATSLCNIFYIYRHPSKVSYSLFILKFICCGWFTANVIYELSLLGFYINRMHHPVSSIQHFPVYKNKLASIFKKMMASSLWLEARTNWGWGQLWQIQNMIILRKKFFLELSH